MQFGFDAVCKNGGGILLDDFELGISPVGVVDEIADKEFRIQNYPNPFTEYTILTFDFNYAENGQ